MPQLRPASGLPIETILEELTQTLFRDSCAVLSAEPGAGKTTAVPLALLESGLVPPGRKIVMLQPRRVAARAAAERLSAQVAEPVGQSVGYRMALESRAGKNTRIEVVTEGILTRMLQSDPEIPEIGLIIFDEFHERSLQADLGLALALEIRDSLRPDLKILVMSATMDSHGVAALIAGPERAPAPIIHCRGRLFPVEVQWGNLAGANGQIASFWRDSRTFLDLVAATVRRVFAERPGDVLLFLPGVGEIRRVAAALAGLDADVLPLHGSLNLREQAKVLASSTRRKVILATSVAETSLTIEGITTVIDSGLTRLNRFDARLGMDRLMTEPCSQAASLQRQGRAGRTQAGVCLKLWPQVEQLKPWLEAEIQRADLAGFVLEAANWGIADAGKLRLLSPPDPGLWQQAVDLLGDLGALDQGLITAKGRAMAALPMHPRLAAMNCGATEAGQAHLAAAIAAALAQRDLLPNHPSADFSLRLECLFNSNDPLAERGRELYARWTNDLPDTAMADRAQAGALLAQAFPDRIGIRQDTKRRHKGDLEAVYQLSNGRQALLRGADAEHAPAYLVAIDADAGDQNARIYQFARLPDDCLDLPGIKDRIETRQEIDWEAWKIRPSQRRFLGKLRVEEKPLPLAALNQGQIGQTVLRRLGQEGLVCLPWDDDSLAELRRLRWSCRRLREWEAQQGKTWPGSPKEMPGLEEIDLLENAGEWLLPWLKLSGGPVIDSGIMAQAVTSLIPWEAREFLNREAPTHLTVPSGSRRPIDYRESESPRLGVRIQEIFGMEHQPTILGVSLVLELLSPANRPLQVTSDLDSFWDRTWPEIRKEMRGRYPKHYWPDDPRQAEPTARAKPRK